MKKKLVSSVKTIHVYILMEESIWKQLSCQFECVDTRASKRAPRTSHNNVEILISFRVCDIVFAHIECIVEEKQWMVIKSDTQTANDGNKSQPNELNV